MLNIDDEIINPNEGGIGIFICLLKMNGMFCQNYGKLLDSTDECRIIIDRRKCEKV